MKEPSNHSPTSTAQVMTLIYLLRIVQVPVSPPAGVAKEEAAFRNRQLTDACVCTQVPPLYPAQSGTVFCTPYPRKGGRSVDLACKVDIHFVHDDSRGDFVPRGFQQSLDREAIRFRSRGLNSMALTLSRLHAGEKVMQVSKKCGGEVHDRGAHGEHGELAEAQVLAFMHARTLL